MKPSQQTGHRQRLVTPRSAVNVLGAVLLVGASLLVLTCLKNPPYQAGPRDSTSASIALNYLSKRLANSSDTLTLSVVVGGDTVVSRRYGHTGDIVDTLDVPIQDSVWFSARVRNDSDIVIYGGETVATITETDYAVVTIDMTLLLDPPAFTDSLMADSGLAGREYTDTLRFSAPPGIAARCSLLAAPSGMLLSDSIVSWTPSEPGTSSVVAVIMDQYGLADTLTWQITVSHPAIALLARMAIYSRAGDPADTLTAYDQPPAAQTTTADNAVRLVAKAFTPDSTWLSDYETDPVFAGLIRWQVRDTNGVLLTQSATGIGILTDTSGDRDSTGHALFYQPYQAYRTVDIVASIDTAGISVFSTVRLQITPGPAHHLVIEKNPVLNGDNPVDTVRMYSDAISDTILAVVRDSWGNFVSYAQSALWSSSNTSLLDVSTGLASQGQGVISKLASTGGVYVYASQAGIAPDTVFVEMLMYTIQQLRILVDGAVLATDLTAMVNDTVSLSVQGMRSDNSQWTNVDGDWSTVPGSIPTVPPPPTASNAWKFAPSDTGSGVIIARLGTDSTTIPDTLGFRFEADLTTGLLAYYPFNGNANDESGNGNHGTVNGATLTTDRFGNANAAYRFDGLDDYVAVPTTASLDISEAITIEAWVQVHPVGSTDAQIVSKHQGGAYALDIRSSAPQLIVYIDGAYRTCASTQSLSDSATHHLVGTYDGSRLRLYVDGVGVKEAIQTGRITTTTVDLNIGANPGITGPAPGWFFRGVIDDVRIYNRALSAAEIDSLYHEGGWVGDTAGNERPYFTHDSTAMTDAANVGMLYLDTLHAEDPDGDNLVFTLLNTPSGMTVSDSVVVWTPSTAQAQLHAVSIEVSDRKGGADTLSWTITVTLQADTYGGDTLYFEDFDAYPDSTHPSDWEFAGTQGEPMIVIDGKLTDVSSGWEYETYKGAVFGDAIYEYDIYIADGSNGNKTLRWRCHPDSTLQMLLILRNDNARDRLTSADNLLDTSVASPTSLGLHHVTIRDSSGHIDVYVDGVPKLSGVDERITHEGYISFGCSWGSGSYIDNVLVRRIDTTGSSPVSDGLVAYYPFTGNADDSSGNGNNGTVFGATLVPDRFGNPASAYSFDGLDDYIDCEASASLQFSQAPTTAPGLNCT